MSIIAPIALRVTPRALDAFQASFSRHYQAGIFDFDDAGANIFMPPHDVIVLRFAGALMQLRYSACQPRGRGAHRRRAEGVARHARVSRLRLMLGRSMRSDQNRSKCSGVAAWPSQLMRAERITARGLPYRASDYMI